MKNLFRIICLLAIMGMTHHAWAQDDGGKSTSNFRFGIKGAPSLAWLKPDSKAFESAGSQVKFAYGLITEFKLGKTTSFVTGLDVAYAGGKLNFKDSVWYTEAGDTSIFHLMKRKYTLQYVDLPLLLKMKTNEIGYMTYFAQFGFNLGFNIKSRAVDEVKQDKSTTTVVKEDVNVIKDVNFMRVALNIGLGVEYNITGNTSLLIAANYNNGFTNSFLGSSKSLMTKQNEALKTKAFSNYMSLTVGFLF
ncbi:MAG: PorT family protein [Flavobacteriales bacterium]|nr:PorT family protein [Flavobacteriales bacterium]